MRVRFQADADFNEDILSGVVRRNPGVDFKDAVTAGLRGLTDREVLIFAAQEGRVLVTHDRRTMPLHFAEFIDAGDSPGVFIISQSAEISSVIEELIVIWEASDAAEWVNRICTIPL